MANFNVIILDKKYYLANDKKTLISIEDVNLYDPTKDFLKSIEESNQDCILWDSVINHFKLNKILYDNFKDSSKELFGKEIYNIEIQIIQINKNSFKGIDNHYTKYFILFVLDEEKDQNDKEHIYLLENNNELKHIERVLLPSEAYSSFTNCLDYDINEKSMYLIPKSYSQERKLTDHKVLVDSFKIIDNYCNNYNLNKDNIKEFIIGIDYSENYSFVLERLLNDIFIKGANNLSNMYEFPQAIFIPNKPINLAWQNKKEYYVNLINSKYFYNVTFDDKKMTETLESLKDFDEKLMLILDIFMLNINGHKTIIDIFHRNDKYYLENLKDMKDYKQFREFEVFKDNCYNLYFDDNLLTRNIIKPIILKVYKSFMSNPENFRILNKFIRLYYKNEKISDNHIGKIYIEWFVDNVLLPKASKGVDLHKKFGITYSNITKITVQV
jgi:hypothetical protein